MNNVIPIPPPYYSDQTLDLTSVEKYLEYLANNKVRTVMTTAGTSQFNLLTTNEINSFNRMVSSFPGKVILGAPGRSLHDSAFHISRNYDTYYSKNVHVMALYPDRYYDDDSIYNYMRELKRHTNKMYLHAMPMKAGRGGYWDYKADLICKLYNDGIICGIKEEHSNLQESFNFVRKLPEGLDVIVAGGSMRRHQFLKNAGANSFLAGIGNLFPEIEHKYCRGEDADKQIDLESKLFDVFNKHGWHRSLRIGLTCLGLYPEYDRKPWPERTEEVVNDIKKVIAEIQNE